jgi:hypothetical protein
MEAFLFLEQREVEEVFESHLALLFARAIHVTLVEEVEVLRWGYHQRAAHGMSQDDQALHTHADIVPTALVVFVREVSVMVEAVVGSDRALIDIISGNDLPIDDL